MPQRPLRSSRHLGHHPHATTRSPSRARSAWASSTLVQPQHSLRLQLSSEFDLLQHTMSHPSSTPRLSFPSPRGAQDPRGPSRTRRRPQPVSKHHHSAPSASRHPKRHGSVAGYPRARRCASGSSARRRRHPPGRPLGPSDPTNHPDRTVQARILISAHVIRKRLASTRGKRESHFAHRRRSRRGCVFADRRSSGQDRARRVGESFIGSDMLSSSDPCLLPYLRTPFSRIVSRRRARPA